MTRGTRGDVQPFVALARGLCSERGWLVTICTEARWKEWMMTQCADITAGAVRFVCSGGDTQRQTETWVSKEIMGSKTEALQELMLAASEANFFASAPVFMHHLARLQAAAAPKVDLIINAFTLTGVALMCGEAHGIPVAGFCLQPTCIPSDDEDWHAIVPIDSGGDSLIDRAEAKLFTSHTSLKPVRRAFNDFPWSGLSLPALRAQFGLEASITWKAAFRWQLPLVIPMLPSSFKRPSDWPASFACTDFLFLRSSAPGGGKLSAEQAEFVEAARAKGRKLMVMTFSSMPVPP
jgi:sterol 3beta-glucosyltransferase